MFDYTIAHYPQPKNQALLYNGNEGAQDTTYQYI